jgi:hypothetical protein
MQQPGSSSGGAPSLNLYRPNMMGGGQSGIGGVGSGGVGGSGGRMSMEDQLASMVQNSVNAKKSAGLMNALVAEKERNQVCVL